MTKNLHHRKPVTQFIRANWKLHNISRHVATEIQNNTFYNFVWKSTNLWTSILDLWRNYFCQTRGGADFYAFKYTGAGCNLLNLSLATLGLGLILNTTTLVKYTYVLKLLSALLMINGMVCTIRIINKLRVMILVCSPQ